MKELDLTKTFEFIKGKNIYKAKFIETGNTTSQYYFIITDEEIEMMVVTDKFGITCLTNIENLDFYIRNVQEK